MLSQKREKKKEKEQGKKMKSRMIRLNQAKADTIPQNFGWLCQTIKQILCFLLELTGLL